MEQDQEKRLLDGVAFCPGDPKLKAIKLRCHELCSRYNALLESQSDQRNAIARDIFAGLGEGCFFQGPMYIHYGTHTRIGHRFFGNFNLTIQDDAPVTIGDDCNFGPGVTIVTPSHPLVASERRAVKDENGGDIRICWAAPVTIGNDCWFGANVTVCPGVTIGDGCVIGAGSVVTRDIPPHSLAAGVPCRVLRPITEADSMANKPELMAGYTVE